MPLSEDTRITIGILSYRVACIGVVIALFGGVCAYDAYGERIFQDLWSLEKSEEGARYGLGGLLATLVSAGIFLWSLPRKSP